MRQTKAEKQIEHFDNRAYIYYCARNQAKNVFYRRLLFRYCLNGISIKKEKIRVLEPMCGYGIGKKIMEEKYGKERIIYEGFDASAEIIRFAKHRFPDGNFQVRNVLEMSEKNKYDVVIVIGGVHHVPDYAPDVLRRFYDALVPGGVFINFEPTYNSLVMERITKAIYSKNASFQEETERRFSLEELNSLFKIAGFKIKKQLYPGLLSYLLWYNPQIFKLLNIGDKELIRKVFLQEQDLYIGKIGKKYSVATFSVLKKRINKEKEL